jgi:serine/threonine-protein kinase
VKQCPQCKLVYADATLNYCLDDGTTLVERTADSEPATRLIPSPHETGEDPTQSFRAIDHSAATAEVSNRTKIYLAAAVLAVLVLGGAFFGYRYFSGSESGHIGSIAVMPFVNASGNPENEYLSDGIAESLINSLSQLPNLKVASRNSAFRYKGRQTDDQALGRELDVRAILNGDLKQIGDQLVINVRLDDASDGRQIWGEQFQRKLSDILALQRDIAQEVTAKLRLKLSDADEQQLRKSYTENADAYQFYLKGNFYAGQYTKEGLAKGIEYYNQAITADPNYALAYAGLAYYYIVQADWYQPANESMPKARDAAQRALKIDENVAAAHTSLGTVAFWYDWDWRTAEKEFQRAIELDPGDSHARQYYSLFLVCLGRGDEAVNQAKKGQQLEPLSAEVTTFLGVAFIFSRRYDEAIGQQLKAVEMEPSNWFAHNWLGRAYAGKGQFVQAIAEYNKADQLQDDLPEVLANLGFAHAQSGNRVEALKTLDRLEKLSKIQYVPPFNFAVIYAGLGDKDRAIYWLERAHRDKGSSIPWIASDPQFDSLRSDERFTELCRRVGFQP